MRSISEMPARVSAPLSTSKKTSRLIALAAIGLMLPVASCDELIVEPSAALPPIEAANVDAGDECRVPRRGPGGEDGAGQHDRRATRGRPILDRGRGASLERDRARARRALQPAPRSARRRQLSAAGRGESVLGSGVSVRQPAVRRPLVLLRQRGAVRSVEGSMALEV